MTGIRVGFVPLYRIEYPSSRYRVFQFLEPLRERGFETAWIEAPQRSAGARLLYLPRLLHLARRSDVLYVQKRLLPIWVLRLVQRVNSHVVYDLDDAIYLREEHRPLVQATMRGATCVVAGNETLAAYARQFNGRVVVIPSVVEASLYCPPDGPRHPGDERVVLGWIGMDPNRGDLAPMPAVFDWLGERYGSRVVLRIVSGEPLEMETRLPVEFVPWSLGGSREELQRFDVGIMPLDDNAWNRAKCGFKLIQYLSVGAPAVASPVGVNSKIVRDGVTGYLAKDSEAWCDRLARTIDDRESRIEMGRAGRARVERRYSVEAVLPTLCDVLVEGARRA
jgi:glycosyltransferase involved in cell wall biosynthesis